MIKALPALAVAVTLLACDAPKETATAPSASSPPKAAATPAPTPKPTATVAAVKPSHECPEGTEGEGTQKEPCTAKGTARIMTVKWTGKITDKGPSFVVVSKSKLEILYGSLFVYFYDKAGKQLDVKKEDETKPNLGCSGNIFAGPMKPGEKATLWFSCVKKDHVPEGTVAIEAELRTVGFTAESGKKSDTFWRNDDLIPDKRPKGGIK